MGGPRLAVHSIHELLSGENAAGVAGQGVQEVELCSGERDLAVPQVNAARRGVHGQRPDDGSGAWARHPVGVEEPGLRLGEAHLTVDRTLRNVADDDIRGDYPHIAQT